MDLQSNQVADSPVLRPDHEERMNDPINYFHEYSASSGCAMLGPVRDAYSHLRSLISLLLEYAAAMSSAQEKVTGNSKLDLAGVMAALALARQEEASLSTVRGQRSFLHTNYNRAEGGNSGLVRAELVQTSEENTATRLKNQLSGESMDHKGLDQGLNYNEEKSSDSAAKLSRNGGVKNIVQSADLSARTGRKKFSDCKAAFENLTSNGKNGQSSISSSSSSLESSGSPGTPLQSLKSSTGGAQYLRQSNNECEKTETAGLVPALPRNSQETLTDKDNGDSQDRPAGPDMAGFLSVVEKLSEEKERRTGSGRLEMSELVLALNDFQSKPASSVPAKAPAPSSAPVSAPASVPTTAPPSCAGSVTPASAKPTVPARPPAQRPTGPPRPPPPPVPLSAQTEQFRTSNSSYNSNKRTFMNSQLNQNTERNQISHHHATSNTRQLQQHTSSSMGGTGTTGTTGNSGNTFTDEKNTLLGELRSKLNNENTMENTKQSAAPRRNLQVSNPSQDQVVNKIVYNQYREMLNSYRNNK